MTEQGPWSVKGIGARARAAARDAARSEGLSLGEYLNRLILEESRDDYTGDIRHPLGGRAGPADTLDQLARRVEAVEARSTLAITGIDQSVMGLVARLDQAESGQTAIASHVDTLIDELRETHAALSDKVKRLETDGRAEQNLEALKSLEQALGKLASHVYEENARAQEEKEAIRGRVEAGFSDLSDRVEGVETRIETTLSDAAKRVEQAVDAAELRGEGATRHLSQRFSELEARVERELGDTETSGKRLDRIEADMTGAIGSVEQTLLRIQERLSRAETTTDSALKGLEATFRRLGQRIDGLESQTGPEAVRRLRSELEMRFDGLAEELKSQISEARSDMARQISETDPEAVAGVQADVKEVCQTLAESDARHTRAFEAMGEQVSRLSASFDRRLRDVETAESGAPALKADIDRLSKTVEHRLAEIDTREASAIERVGNEVGRLAERLEARVDASEKSSANAIEQIGEQVAGVARRLQSRQDEAIERLRATFDESRNRQEARLSDALANVTERLEKLHTEASTQLSPVQRAIASLAERLERLERADPAISGDDPSDDDVLEAFAAAVQDVTAEPAAMTGTDDIDEFTASLPDWDEAPSGEGEPAGDRADSTETGPASDEEGFDPLAELGDWPGEQDLGADETRDADIFDGEPDETEDEDTSAEGERMPPAHLDLDRNMPRAAQNFGSEEADTDLEEDLDASDYITRARRAALAAGDPAGGDAMTGRGRRMGRLPLYAAASAVVLTAAGTTTALYLRGKQPSEGPVMAGAAGPSSEPAAALAAVLEDEPPAPVGTADETDAPSPPGLAGEPGVLSAASAVFEPPLPAAEPEAEPETVPEPALPRFDPIPPRPTLQEAAARGEPVALFQLGLAQLDAQAFAEGAEHIREAAEAGLPAAQYRLAKLHEQGLGVPRDLAAARRWTERAAEGGNVRAMHDVAVFHAEGEGGPRSYARAVEWFRKASEYGVVDSQYNLGVLFEEGLGITPDLEESLFWFTVAAGQGDGAATARATAVAARLSPEAASSARARAAAWQPAKADPAANGEFPRQSWEGAGAAQIRAVQTALNALGYAAGAPDGVMGPATRAAIEAYQADAGLGVTGRIDAALIGNLNTLAGGA